MLPISDRSGISIYESVAMLLSKLQEFCSHNKKHQLAVYIATPDQTINCEVKEFVDRKLSVMPDGNSETSTILQKTAAEDKRNTEQTYNEKVS